MFQAYPGDNIDWTAMDWYCSYLDLNGGRSVVCSRPSSQNGVFASVTGQWIRIWDFEKRGAGCCKKLLFEHRR